MTKLLPLILMAASLGAQSIPKGYTVLPGQSGNSPAAAIDVYQTTGGVKYSGPQAAAPSVTPTLNTNMLQYTGEMAGFWQNWNQLSMTGGQSDENSANTATLIVPTAVSRDHRMGFPAIWEPSLTGTTSIALSVFAKPFGSTQTTFFMYLQLSDGSGSLITNYTNASTCTNISASAGTASATSAGNGYCKVGLIYTLPAATYVQQVFFGCSTSTTSSTFTGNGTDGCYISHPMLGVGSSLPTYQDVTSMHRYACIAYDANGNTAGISPWITSTSYPAAAEVNSVTCPAVTNGVTYYAYRTGGYTQGKYPVTAGTALNDNSLVFDGTAPIVGPVINTVSNPIPDTRVASMQSTLVMQSFTATGACTTVGNIEPGAQGTMTGLRISATLTNSGFFASHPDNTKIHFLIDGAALNSAQDQIVSWGGEFLMEGNPTKFNAGFAAISMQTAGFFGAWRSHEIPFVNGLQVVICGTTSDSTASVNAEVFYKLGQYYSSPYRKHWHVYDPGFQTVTQYSSYDILPTVTSTGGGEVDYMELYLSDGALYSFLEGNVTGVCDGAQCFITDGTENLVQCSQYCNFGGYSQQNDHWGDWMASALANPLNTYDFWAYRNFGRPGYSDTIFFQNNIHLFNQNGQQQEGPGGPGSIQAKVIAAYWTQQ